MEGALDEEYRLTTSIGYMLNLVSRMHEERLEALLKGISFTRGEFKVLLAVAKEGRHQPSEIADFLGVEKPSISRILSRLQRQGLLKAGKSDTDKRARYFGITPFGLQRLEEGIAAATAANRTLLRDFKNEEKALLVGLLRKLRGTGKLRLSHL
jgi:DNA-binding MarR family transcriptional regulator